MGLLNLRIDDDLARRLALEAERERRSRSEIVRDALSSFFRERDRRKFLDEIARAARELAPVEARAIAEEALPLDNEAVHAAQPRTAYRAGKGKGRKR